MTAPSRRRHRLLVVLCAAAWLAAFVLTHVPLPAPAGRMPSDKLMHAVGYGGLALLYWLVLWSAGHRPRRRAVQVMAVLLVYGAIDEATQPLVNRFGDVKDWLFDALGAAGVVAILEIGAWLIRRRRTRASLAQGELERPSLRR